MTCATFSTSAILILQRFTCGYYIWGGNTAGLNPMFYFNIRVGEGSAMRGSLAIELLLAPALWPKPPYYKVYGLVFHAIRIQNWIQSILQEIWIRRYINWYKTSIIPCRTEITLGIYCVFHPFTTLSTCCNRSWWEFIARLSSILNIMIVWTPLHRLTLIPAKQRSILISSHIL